MGLRKNTATITKMSRTAMIMEIVLSLIISFTSFKPS